jgi:hypothetical protein
LFVVNRLGSVLYQNIYTVSKIEGNVALEQTTDSKIPRSKFTA